MNDIAQEQDLLPPDALAGICVGMSVSESPDLSRLGLLETHFRLALGEMARCVLVSGGHVAYGGHLNQEGYTVFLATELERYGRADQPLHIFLAWQEHRKLPLNDLKATEKTLGLKGRVIYLDQSGHKIDPSQGRKDEANPEKDIAVVKKSLTSLRHYMANHTHGRIFIGGKRAGFQGDLPGIAEEALISLEAGQPIYLAGGYGGMTVDIIRALGIDKATWLPPGPDMNNPDDRFLKAMDMLSGLSKGWKGLNNGLNDEENKKLAASHRPSEIAALISLGLGRIYHKKK